MAPWKLAAFGIATGLLYLTLYLPTSVSAGVLAFISVNAAGFLPLSIIAWRFLFARDAIPPAGMSIVLIITFGMLFRLALVPLSPIGSDDIYRYVWDGKVALSGTNPFALAPNDPALAPLHTDDLPSSINFPHMRTIYPPLAQGFFLLSNVLFGDSIAGMKFLLVLCELCTVLLLLLLLKHFNMNPAAVVLYAWSPLPIMYFGLDGHIDALGIPLLLLCIFLFARNRAVTGAVSLGLAALAKLYPMFVVPLLLNPWRWRTLGIIALPVLLFIAGCLMYVEPTGGLLEPFKVFTAGFEFNGGMFSLMKFLLQSNLTARIVCAVCFVGWILITTALDRTFVEKVFLAFLGYVIFSPVVHPWYLTWLAVLLVLRWSPAVFLLLVLSNLSNIIVYQYRVFGVWQDSPLLMSLQYLPFFGVLMWELTRWRSPSNPLLILVE
jgi:alpha-1,6-mannosyltransferase